MEKLWIDHESVLRVSIRVEYVKFTGWRATGADVVVLGTEPWVTLGRLTHELYTKYTSFYIERVEIEGLECGK